MKGGTKMSPFVLTKTSMKLIRSIILLAASCLAAVSCSEKPKYVFLFIGDGMGFAHVAAAQSYKAFSETGEFGSKPLSFTEFPVLGWATSFSASNPITCSSAAGTALSTGYKTNNGMLGIGPDSTKLTSISYKIHDAGYKVGIMSSVNVDHATPAAFYAHSAARSDYYSIGQELCATGFEFFGGGGFISEKQVKRHEGEMKSVYDITEENGYVIACGLDEFQEKKCDKIVLLQENDKKDNILSYAINRKEGDLALSDIVASAIEVLDNEKGFFMMAEGGLIDWTAHGQDLAGTIFEVLDLSDAVEVAVNFYKKHPKQTLIVVTADHETGGLALARGKGYKFDLSVIDGVKGGSTEKDVNNYMDDKVAVDSINVAANIGWTTTSHSGIPVPVFAIGAGSKEFSGQMDNTDIPKKICALMGVEF